MKKIKLDGFQEIPNTNGKYLIHPDGRVYSHLSNKFLTHTIQKDGRRTVSMKYVGSKGTVVAVSRLLAETFLPNPNNLKHVILKDGDPRNLNLSNVEWSNSKPKHDGGKYIEGYEHLYKIYRDGRVYSIRRRKFMTPRLIPNGTLYVALTDSNGVTKHYLLATLLYSHFIRPLRPGERVTYKDKTGTNISLSNLRAEWL